MAGASKTDSGGAVVSRCPAGHRFNSSPRHRSAKRCGVGGKKIFKQTWCPVEDTDLPPRMARNVPTSEIRGSKHSHTRIVFNTSTEFCSLTSYFLELNNGSRALWIAFRTSSASVDPCPSAVHVQIGRCVSADMN